MKKIISLTVCVLLASYLMAQDNPTPKKKQNINLSNRPNDHFMIQLGYLGWSGIPDTITTGGLSKSFNMYYLFDFPFKSNPKMSMAFGPGIGSDQMLFKETYVGIKDLTPRINFTNQSDTNHFKKTKLATVYLEAPIELRFSADPLNGKGFKAAIGIKVGTMISAHTRNSKFQNSADQNLNDYVMKESSKRFFNKNRLVGSVRLGYGHISLYGQYQLGSLFKDGAGPDVKPFSIGITLSGL